jgi:DNA-binding winged helix-turn-helix (wHTH) protein
MSAVVVSEELPALSQFGPAQMALERAQRLFRRARYTVTHALRIASGNNLITRVPEGNQTRFVPCAWGVRRDDYRWRGDGGRDFAALRSGASTMGWALVHAPLRNWSELLPGAMADVMGTRSDLYLADYWLLTVHHLLWSKRLPYPIKARWLHGANIHDQPFSFTSELPTDLAEASLDALILFREAAVTPPRGVAAPNTAVEPPVFRDGQWHLMTREAVAPAIQTPSTVRRPEPPPQAVAPQDAMNGSDVLPELNDQTFTVRCGGRTYRFTARNKQLFALLDRVRRRPGHRVSFDDLRANGDVWDGSQVEDSSICGAVARLRKLLKTHGMDALAERVSTGTYQGRGYVVLQTAEGRDGAS